MKEIDAKFAGTFFLYYNMLQITLRSTLSG